MEKKTHPAILDETESLSLKEFCFRVSSQENYIIEMVEFGILEPEGKSADSWQFTLYQLQRFKKAQRLQHDLDINLSGVALSLDLLDQLRSLQDYVDQLEHQLQLSGHR